MRIVWGARVRPGLRERVAEILGVDAAEAGEIAALAAAAHDLGKVTAWFQYQERYGAAADFADELAAATRLPRTPSLVKMVLNSEPQHPLRRHEFISHRILAGQWVGKEQPIHHRDWLAILVGGHHGYWRQPEDTSGWVGHGRGEEFIDGWTDEQQALLNHVEKTLGYSVAEVGTLPREGGAAAFVVLSGLLTMADWLASDDTQVREGKCHWDKVFDTDDDPYASPEAARRWMDRRHEELRTHVLKALGPYDVASRDAFARATLGQHRPRPLQAEALGFERDDQPGLWIAMYPTGDGKTEAALLRGAVSEEEGLFFGLPTTATTDAMEKRLESLADRLGDADAFPVVKSHQFASLMKEGNETKDADGSDDQSCDHASPSWYTASIRKLVAPNVVGTVDQALAGALAQRHITLRLFGLANHYVVLDEVHTFDPYQTQLLLELLNWWGATRTRVTLLSATLPTSHMRSMVGAYRAGLLGVTNQVGTQQVTDLPALFPSTVSVTDRPDGTVDVTVRRPEDEVRRPQDTVIEVAETVSRADRIDTHVEWARRTAAAHTASPIAIISNVVADCTAIAQRLADDVELARTHDVICLHSGLVSGHRQATESALLTRAGFAAHQAGFDPGDDRRPVVVVGTQVIQASLDFDVDFMSTDLAPAPDLIQRLGRAWRFEGAFDTFRGGRLPVSLDRSLHVVAVVGDDGVPSRAGSVPYLAAVLRRTYAALVAEVERRPLVDILAFSQEWVDAAYDRDPYALLSEEQDEQTAALDEELDVQRKEISASLSRAALGAMNNDQGILLLPHPKRSGPRWQELVSLTQRNDDENLMRTRFIERESVAVIAFDSSGDSSYLDPDSGAHVVFPNLSVEELAERFTGDVVPLLEQWRLQVPAALVDVVEKAITDTLGGSEWQPRSRMLKSTRPLDLRNLVGVNYHPQTGLTKEVP